MTVIHVIDWKTQIMEGTNTLDDAFSSFSPSKAKIAIDSFGRQESEFRKAYRTDRIYELEREEVGDHDLWLLGIGIGKHASQMYADSVLGKNRPPDFLSVNNPDRVLSYSLKDKTFSYKVVNCAAEQLIRESNNKPIIETLYKIAEAKR